MVKVPLDDQGDLAQQQAADVLSLDEALESLAKFDAKKSRTIELRFFGGLTIEETAEAMGLSTATVIKNTRFARAWLHAEIYSASSSIEP